MSDPLPPLPPSPPQAHPGPPTGWRPLSGLAVTSFVLSLLFGLLALFGLWFSEVIPLGLGVLTLRTVRISERRGRLLAIWAVIIAICFGSCGYAVHANLRGQFGHMAESLLSALSAEGGAEVMDEGLRPWIYKQSLDEDAELLSKIRARYGEVEEALGPYQERIDLGTPLLGFTPLFMAPRNVVEFGTGERPPEWKFGTVVWVRAQFERGTAHVAIRLGSEDEEGLRGVQGAEASDPVPIVSDVRFFRDASGVDPGVK